MDFITRDNCLQTHLKGLVCLKSLSVIILEKSTEIFRNTTNISIRTVALLNSAKQKKFLWAPRLILISKS